MKTRPTKRSVGFAVLSAEQVKIWPYLTPQQMRLLPLLLSHMPKIFVAQGNLAERARVSRKTVNKVLKQLQELGIITAQARRRNGGWNSTCQYTPVDLSNPENFSRVCQQLGVPAAEQADGDALATTSETAETADLVTPAVTTMGTQPAVTTKGLQPKNTAEEEKNKADIAGSSSSSRPSASPTTSVAGTAASTLEEVRQHLKQGRTAQKNHAATSNAASTAAVAAVDDFFEPESATGGEADDADQYQGFIVNEDELPPEDASNTNQGQPVAAAQTGLAAGSSRNSAQTNVINQQRYQPALGRQVPLLPAAGTNITDIMNVLTNEPTVPARSALQAASDPRMAELQEEIDGLFQSFNAQIRETSADHEKQVLRKNKYTTISAKVLNSLPIKNEINPALASRLIGVARMLGQDMMAACAAVFEARGNKLADLDRWIEKAKAKSTAKLGMGGLLFDMIMQNDPPEARDLYPLECKMIVAALHRLGIAVGEAGKKFQWKVDKFLNQYAVPLTAARIAFKENYDKQFADFLEAGYDDPKTGKRSSVSADPVDPTNPIAGKIGGLRFNTIEQRLIEEVPAWDSYPEYREALQSLRARTQQPQRATRNGAK